MSTQQTAATQYIVADNGIKFAYRRVGASNGIPLVMHIHFRTNMDFWDPILINALAAVRPVILFDQAGVGRTTGEIPLTQQGWANDLISFVKALRLAQIDLLGFSMGGMAVQMVALTEPQLIRRLILAGTTASTPIASGLAIGREDAPPAPIQFLSTATTPDEVEHSLAYSFFYDDDEGRAAFRMYWKRVHERNVKNEPQLLEFVDAKAGAKRAMAAAREWSKPNPRNSFPRLRELQMPVLVANGDNDVLIPTSRSWELMSNITNAQLIIYPRAGHGFIWQYAELFARHVNMFLERSDRSEVSPKL